MGMYTSKQVYFIFTIAALIFTGAWALNAQNSVETQNSADNVSPADFDPQEPREVPDTTIIDVDIKGLSTYGKIFMIEGLENESAVRVEREVLTSGVTTYPPLVIHGIFSKQIRDWRDEVIAGSFSKREIEIDLINGRGDRALRIRVYNAWPRSFSFPPLNVDGSTRYMERIEFMYDRFEITN